MIACHECVRKIESGHLQQASTAVRRYLWEKTEDIFVASPVGKLLLFLVFLCNLHGGFHFARKRFHRVVHQQVAIRWQQPLISARACYETAVWLM